MMVNSLFAKDIHSSCVLNSIPNHHSCKVGRQSNSWYSRNVFQPANEVWGKAMFSQVFVCPLGVCLQGGLHPASICLQGSASGDWDFPQRGFASRGSAYGGLPTVGVGHRGVGILLECFLINNVKNLPDRKLL